MLVKAGSVYQLTLLPIANKSGITDPSHAICEVPTVAEGKGVTVISRLTGSPIQPLASVSTTVIVYVPGVTPQSTVMLSLVNPVLIVPPPVNVHW